MPEADPPVPTSSADEARGLQRLKQVSWGSAVQVVLLILAVALLVRTVAGVDLQDLVQELQGASWALVAGAFVLGQTPRLTQTLSTLGAAPRPVPMGPVYQLQLAQGYVGLAVPSSAARIAMGVRFFQKQGFTSGAALAIGGLDSFSGFLVEAALLLGLLVFTPQTLHFDLDAPALPEWRTILVVIVVLAALLAVVSALLPGTRRQFAAWAKNLLADGRSALRDLRSPRRLLLLLGGNLGSILLSSATLGLFVAALGASVSFSDLVVMTISVSLLAGLLPVPGGIGVVESGLTFGLVASGVPEDMAFAAVVLFRLATFYIPPAWGFVAFRTLERNDYL